MQMRNILRFFTGAAVFLTALSGAALDNAHVKGNYETPHIPWEKPAETAKKKILFFNYYSGGVGRYPAELAQRYNIEYETAFFNSDGVQPQFLGKDEGMSRAEALIRRGDWDAFVFWGCNPSSLLEKNQKAYMLFLQQVVRNGAGVVVVDGNEDPKILKEKNRLKDVKIPLYGNQLAAEFYTVGKGRGARLNNFDAKTLQKQFFSYQRNRPVMYSEGWRDQYEMRLGDVYSALRWSMNAPLNPPAIRIDGKQLSVTADADGRLEVFVSGMGEKFILADGKKVKKGETSVFDLPELFPGRFLIGAIIRDSGGVRNFGGIHHEISKNAAAKINRIQLNPDFGKTGSTITGNVDYQGNGTLTLRLRDPQRRILLEKPLSGNGKTADFDFLLESFLPSLITVEAELADGQKILDRETVYCKKTIDRKNRFDVMLWGYHEFATGSIDVNGRLAELGVNELVGFAPVLSPHEILYMPPRGGPLRIRNAHDDKACWLSPEFMAAKRQELHQAFKDTSKSGMKRIMFGDEGPVQLGCLSTHCQKEYRDFLKRKYSTLDALNKAWKTSFTDWNQVGLSMIPEKNGGKDLAAYGKQVYLNPDSSTRNHAINTWGVARPRDWNQLVSFYQNDANAREYYNDQFLMQDCGSMLAKNYTRWFDRCEFRSYAMAKALKEMDRCVKELYPDTATGLSGTLWIGIATNFDLLMDAMSCAMTYGRYANNPITELIDSLVPADYACNVWVGYAKNKAPMVSTVWSDILSHPNMFSIYSVFSSPPEYWGVIKPDLGTNVPGKATFDSTEKIRNGLGDILMRSRKQSDPVLVLWSWPSVWAARIEGGETFRLPEDSYIGALQALASLGLRYQFVTAKQVEDGKIPLKNYKTLILPRTDAMSAALAEQIRNFARQGGTVLADVRPGVFGENLEMLPEGRLDKEFGIKRSAPGSVHSSNINLKGAEQIKFDLDGKVTLRGGKALAESREKIPAFIQNQSGKGKFVLLNFPFYHLPSLTQDDFANGAGKEFAGLFRETPPVCIYTRADGARRYGLRNVSWKNGDMEFLFAHDAAETEKPETLSAKLSGSPRFMFDVYGGRQHGKTRDFQFEITPPMPALFVLTDAPLPKLALSVPATVKPGAELAIGYRTDGTMKGLRPAVLTLEYAGKKIPGFRHILLADAKQNALRHKIAFNENKGIYTLVLDDVLTGGQTRTSFDVK